VKRREDAHPERTEQQKQERQTGDTAPTRFALDARSSIRIKLVRAQNFPLYTPTFTLQRPEFVSVKFNTGGAEVAEDRSKSGLKI
jgi:hypothetical protein